jgi:2-polyprenyl-6-methoxyphenol hydroxylase-like FAD-dependent oxidoreductase
MTARKPITIIGGGLAGLALGIGLRQRGVPVTIWEAGSYPRHRVCGEFISGQGRAVLERLGLLERCVAAGAVEARTVLFICGRNRSPVRRLETPALCLSRQVLDALLAEVFQESGGDLRMNARQQGVAAGEGWVRASGRRLQTAAGWPRWFGVKAHVAAGDAVGLAADLEMHLGRDGYVGLNRIGGGEVNVCGLFRVREGGRRVEAKEAWLRGETGSPLRERLGGAAFAPGSFCAVAGLELRPQRAAAREECCIGDALTMTPPITGNGMSMAFESAALAAAALAEYSGGGLAWAAARARVARECDAAFGRRLAWARRLQGVMVWRGLRGWPGAALLRWDWLWRLMLTRTR